MPRDFGQLPSAPLPGWTSLLDRIKRRVNFELYRRFSQRHTLAPYYPFVKLTLDPGNVCNLRCPLCPTGVRDPGRPPGLMHMDTFRRAIDQVGMHVGLLELFNWGEPLVHPRILDMIDYAGKKTKARIVVSTNLTVLSDKLADGLVRSSLDTLLISCDGASEETYAKYRVGGHFSTVMANMQRLVAKRREAGRTERPHFIWRFIVFRHNQHEVPLVEPMAREIGVETEIVRMRTDMAKEITESVRASIERDQEWIPTESTYSAYDLDRKRRKQPTVCWRPWTETAINWDGSVSPCCAVWNKDEDYGNINQQSFIQIWNNEQYVAARQAILGRKDAPETICSTCKRNGYMHF